MVKVRLQIIYIFLLFQMSNSLLISAKVRLIFLLCIPPQKIKYFWPRRDSNTQPSDLESDALPLRHGVTVYWWWDFGLEKREGSTEIWTRIAGFKVQSANHYTIEPCLDSYSLIFHLVGQISKQVRKKKVVSCRVRTGDLVRVKHTW